MNQKSMHDPEEHFDAQLAAQFEREHPQMPDDPFVSRTVQVIQQQRRWLSGLRAALTVTALAGLVLVSPWLITGAAKLNELLESSFTSAGSWVGESAKWVAPLLAVGAVLLMRVRSR